jgi:hypothetical protein
VAIAWPLQSTSRRPVTTDHSFYKERGVFPEICIWEEIFLSSISKNDCVEQLIRCSDLSQTTQPISKQKTIKPNE